MPTSDVKKELDKKAQIKHVITRLLLLLLILSPIILFFPLSYYVLLNDSPVKAPWVSWYDDPHQRVYISWETLTDTKATVRYGTVQGTLTSQVIEPLSGTLHHVNLTGLSPNTKYYYEVVIDGQVFGGGQFRTAPTSNVPFTWVMISDTQQDIGPGHHHRVAADIQDKNYTFIANVGDLVESGGDKRYFNNFFTVASKYLDTIPIVPIIGNHDNRTPRVFTNYFINNAENSKNQFFYSFNWSNVHFQICHFPYGRQDEMTSIQLNWMKQDLKNAQNMSFRIVMFHCPIQGSGYFGISEALTANIRPIMESHNVTAVISGHEHHYERGHMGKVMYLILGGGGGLFDPGLRPLPETEVLTASPCYTEVSATATSLRFITYTLEQDIMDDYIITAGG